MAKPIFVVGKERSGTTWLANLLAAHPQVACVCHERHFGVHESAFFSSVDGRYGDLGEWANYVEFVRIISATDYFRLAGVTEEFLFSLWPSAYEGVFRAVMDRFARQQNAAAWLEKTPGHSLYVKRMASAFPEARFVAVRRDVEPVVVSTLGLTAASRPEVADPGPARKSVIVSTVFSWYRYYKTIDAFAGSSDRVLTVEYDDLRADRQQVLERACAFLELPYTEEVLQSPYDRNTGFGEASRRAREITDGERRRIARASRVARLLPLSWLNRLARLHHRGEGRRPLPRSFFRLLPATERCGVKA